MRLRAWMVKHDSHGLALDSLVLVPVGIEPETPQDWVRVPWLDGEIETENKAPTKESAGQKRSDADWLRNVLLPRTEDEQRLHAIADRFRAIADRYDDDNGNEASGIDFVEWKRFVGLLRESADCIRDEIIADAGHERGNDHPGLALVGPRMREAATRIEKVAAAAKNAAPSHNLATRILKILNGEY